MALEGVPAVAPGDDLADIVIRALAASHAELADGDVLVLAQKIVSKAENRFVDLSDIVPSNDALNYGRLCGKDPRLVELILRESRQVLRCVPGVIIVRHRLGLVLANAGIDQSNLAGGADDERVLLLPQDPEASALRLQSGIEERTGLYVGVAVIDSLGRAWRIGTCGTCIGAAGIETVRDLRGASDLYGRTLQSSIIGIGDELAAGASLVMGQAAEGTPVVLVRGLGTAPGGRAAALIRPEKEDLFP